ncbi:MAG: glycosyltransferase, partial [Pseudomonadota bacterium]
MALDLADAAPGSTIISLEGSTDAVRVAWPRAANAKSDVIALGAPEGFSPQLVWKLAGVLRRLKPSGVVLHHIGPLIYGALAARLVGTKPIIHVEHDVWHYSRNARNAALSRLIERVAKPHHVCLSQSATRTVAETLQTGRIHVVRTGIDTTRFEIPGHAQKNAARAPFGIAPDAIVFGTVSRLVALKGHGLLLDAVAGLQAAVGRPVRVLIVGDGPERTGLEVRVNADAELAPLVHFAGHRDDIGTCLQAMDVFCLPSLNEGTPRSVLEAQATGVPVIASNVGAVDECLEPTLN